MLGQISFKMAPSQHVGGSIPVFKNELVLGGKEAGQTGFGRTETGSLLLMSWVLGAGQTSFQNNPVCGDRYWATFINELRSGHIGQFMEISWKINFKLLKWLVWSSGLGRCGCGHRNPGSNPEVSPLQLFFYFLIVHYIFTCGPDFAKTKKLPQHSISSQNILFTSKSISLYTQDIIIIKEWLLVTSSLYV